MTHRLSEPGNLPVPAETMAERDTLEGAGAPRVGPAGNVWGAQVEAGHPLQEGPAPGVQERGEV